MKLKLFAILIFLMSINSVFSANHADVTNRVEDDTLYMLNGDKRIVKYDSKTKKRIFYKQKSSPIKKSMPSWKVHKIALENGEDILINEQVSQKQYKKKKTKRVFGIIALVLAIPVVAVGFVLLLYVLFPAW